MDSRTLKGLGLVAVSVVALAAAFLVGRATAPDASATVERECSDDTRLLIDVPEQFTGPEGKAYFIECEQQAAVAVELGNPAARVNIYAALDGPDVVAWWYPDCGLPAGVFEVGTPHPTDCAATGSTVGTPAP